MGIIPAPQCPPGYARVVTITPAGWAMAQAGVPGPIVAADDTSTTKPDLIIDYNARDPNEYVEGYTGDPDYNKSSYVTTAPTPLYYQKNTWLRTMVIPYGSGSSFKGWSTVMGFIYPYNYYKKYISLLGLNPSGANSKTIIWNLFPVYNQSIEGYATVYCYFDRQATVSSSSSTKLWNESFVDTTYDQLTTFRPVHNKNNDPYTKRLNDPSLPYTDPW